MVKILLFGIFVYPISGYMNTCDYCTFFAFVAGFTKQLYLRHPQSKTELSVKSSATNADLEHGMPATVL